MKHIFYLIIIFIFSVGCDNKPKMTKEEQRVEDSLVKALNYQILNRDRINDSIAKAEQDKVIGEIEFGMSKKAGEKALNEFIEKSERKVFENSNYTKPFIGNYEFDKYGTYGFYENDELYMFKIKGVDIEYNKLETDVQYQLDYIREVIELKYGEPYLSYSFPKSYDIDDEKDYTCSIWKVGTKEIIIQIDEEGTDYSVDVLIYQPKVLEKISEKRRAEEFKQAEKAKNTF